MGIFFDDRAVSVTVCRTSVGVRVSLGASAAALPRGVEQGKQHDRQHAKGQEKSQEDGQRFDYWCACSHVLNP